MPLLQVVSNDGRMYNYAIEKNKVTIGRSKDNDLVFADNTVSRNHAQIVKSGTGYVLTDLGSFNGTKVNDESVQSILLRHNDQIKIGPARLKFLTREAEERLPTDSLILTPEGEYEKQDQKIVESSPQAEKSSSQELLVAVESQSDSKSGSLAPPSVDASRAQSDITSLERTNKVLFVLYEISRQMNSIQNFNELLRKIMDLIFLVINADYGFLILTGDKLEDDLTPVVVKYKDDHILSKEQLRASRTIIQRVIRDKVALLTSNAMDDSRLDHGKSLFIQKIRSAMCVPLWAKERIIGVIQLDSVRFDNQFTNADLELLKAIGSQMALVIEQASLNQQIREEEMMRSRLERFHSPQVIEMILRSGQEAKDNVMEPSELTATILFTDIIGFTGLSEFMPPRQVNLLLNRYFSMMTDIVFKYDGTLDKYIGDGLMAVFGAPMEKDDDAERAIRAAREMRCELETMRRQGEAESLINVRIGINTGKVVAGNIGSPKRMDYTVIGDPVNLASRLESIAEPNQILIGEETYRLVKDKFTINTIGPRRVKGKSTEITVYEVVG